MADQRTDDQKVKDINRRLEALKKIRQPFEALIDDSIKYCNHGVLTIADGKDRTKGQKTGIDIYDDTAIRANNLRAMGLHGYLFSPGWFKHKLPNRLNFPRTSMLRQYNGKRLDEMPEVAEWLTDAQEVMYSAYSASNWYAISPEVFKMGGSAGCVPIFVDKDIDNDRLWFTPVHIRECYLSRNRWGEVDGVFRVFNMTVREVAEKFGKARMQTFDSQFNSKLENGPYEDMEVLHATYKRESYDAEKIDNINMPYASMWIWNSKLLLESGYPRFPWLVYEERRNTDEWYPRSPGSDAIVAILLANQQGRTNLVAGHRAADPPYALLESLRGRSNLGPGGRTYLKSTETEPKIMDGSLRGLPIAIEFQERTGKAINEYFHTDIFLMMNQIALENKNLTATQVVEMTGEKAAVLSADTERIENVYFQPSIDITFAYEYNADANGMPTGRIPVPPDIILDLGVTKLETDYYGPLSQARERFYKAKSIQAGLSDIAMIANFDPNIVHLLKMEKIARFITGDTFPADCLHSEAEYKAIVDGITKQAQMNQEMAGMIEAAKALPGAGKAIESGSPLAMLTSGEG